MKTPMPFLKNISLAGILFFSLHATPLKHELSNIVTRKINTPVDTSGKKMVTGLTSQQSTEPFSGAIERQLESIESSIEFMAEAMPEDKYYFTPESLNINGSDFKGVRTFAGQVKHLATDNFAIWSPVAGVPLRSDIKDVNGPETIKTKAEILQYLKESFALGHKAVAAVTSENAMDMLPFRGSNLPRLDLAFYALTHDNDHYGQMVVYLRMCGIDPQTGKPAAR